MDFEKVREDFVSQLDKGMVCPVCGRFSKLYGRKLNSSMAWTLMLVYDYYKKEGNLRKWLKVESYLKSLPAVPTSLRGDFPKLRYWKLIIQKEGEVEGVKMGLYRITEKGINFCENRIKVSKVAFVHNRTVKGFSEETVNIVEALGDRFSYKDLIGDSLFDGNKLIPAYFVQGMNFEDKGKGKFVCFSDSGEKYYLNVVRNYCSCPEYVFSKLPKSCHHLVELNKRVEVLQTAER